MLPLFGIPPLIFAARDAAGYCQNLPGRQFLGCTDTRAEGPVNEIPIQIQFELNGQPVEILLKFWVNCSQKVASTSVSCEILDILPTWRVGSAGTTASVESKSVERVLGMRHTPWSIRQWAAPTWYSHGAGLAAAAAMQTKIRWKGLCLVSWRAAACPCSAQRPKPKIRNQKMLGCCPTLCQT